VKKTYQFAGLVAGVALVAAACGDAPDDNGDVVGDEDFLGCMITDEGGVDDKSFNESAHQGLVSAESAGVIGDVRVAESHSTADYGPNLDEITALDCGLIVTVGFLLAADTAEASNANPDERFAIVDYLYTDFDDVQPEGDNVKPLVFNTHEAAFLAGYVAAGYTETGQVATWGGAQIPTVTIFMDGFADGVAHYNEEKGTDVEVLGWDKAAQNGEFVGDFSNTTLALQISENLIDAGADIVLPVAGPLGEQAAIAARDAGDVSVIWVDTDGYESAAEYSELFLTSVLKGITVAVENAVTETVAGNYSNEPFIGTLENDGVGIAPFHDFEDEVSDELKAEVEELRQQIIDGTLTVESDASF
jgi:basic membrane protein A and related proteins